MAVVRKSASVSAGKDPALDVLVEKVLAAIDGADLPEGGVNVTIERASVSVGKASAETEAILAKNIPVHIQKAEERFVLGVVLEPTKEMDQPDTQGDIYSADEVRQAAYRFMEEYQTIGLQHREDVTGRVLVLLNWITLEDSVIGGQKVVAGTWMLGVRVLDDQIWQDVKDGKITGFSIGGTANRQQVAG